MSPRPDVRAERTNQITEAAKAVFARLGFHKARMDDIARETGVSKGTLYLYFKSKDEIITAILDNMVDREVARLRDALDSEHSAKERLLTFAKMTINGITKMKPLMPVLFEFWGLSLRRKPVKQILSKYYRTYFEIGIPIIQQGIDRGEFRPVEAESVAIAIGSIFEGTIILWAYAPETVVLERHIESSIRLLIEGLEVRE